MGKGFQVLEVVNCGEVNIWENIWKIRAISVRCVMWTQIVISSDKSFLVSSS